MGVGIFFCALHLRARGELRAVLNVSKISHRLCACAFATVQCWAFVSRVAAIGQTSMALGLPMAIPHFALVVGFGGTTIVAALLLASDVAELSPTRRGKRAEGA